jgi:hypothetical protein
MKRVPRTCAAAFLLLCLSLQSNHAEAAPVCPPPSEAQSPTPFEGTLQEGCRYSAAVTFDAVAGEWRTVVRLRPALHQGARIEWVNLEEFSWLGRPGAGEVMLVFDVVSREAWSDPKRRSSRVVWSCRVVRVLGSGPAAR